MDLLSAIPGLDIHATAPAPPPAFDRVKAMREMADAAALVDGEMTATGYAWLQQNRPDIFSHLQAVSRDLDEAYEAEDVASFAKAVSLWVRSYQKAAGVYATRPPVVETQAELFT